MILIMSSSGNQAGHCCKVSRDQLLLFCSVWTDCGAVGGGTDLGDLGGGGGADGL